MGLRQVDACRFQSELLLRWRARNKAASNKAGEYWSSDEEYWEMVHYRLCHDCCGFAHYRGYDDTEVGYAYYSGRNKLEGCFFGPWDAAVGEWKAFSFFEAAPKSTKGVPLSLAMGNVFRLHGVQNPAVLVALLAGSKPVAGVASGRRQAVYMALLREECTGCWVHSTFPNLSTPVMTVSDDRAYVPPPPVHHCNSTLSLPLSLTLSLSHTHTHTHAHMHTHTYHTCTHIYT